MSEQKFHTDEQFIPEGLEFRDEYMHAALGAYRRKKRIILWKKTGAAIAILFILAVGSFKIFFNEQEHRQTENYEIRSNEHKPSTDTSSANDLESDEAVLNKHRQSPAVESSEATQDLSSRAVDMGDPMSSGVGLPGQLSPNQSKLVSGSRQPKTMQRPTVKRSTANEADIKEANNHQDSESKTQENQQTSSLYPLKNLTYIPFERFESESTLRHAQTIPIAPRRRWSVFASLGAKIWANYGFGSDISQVDPVLGLGAAYALRNRINLIGRAQFFTVSGVAAPYVATQRQYADGFSETSYSYHTDRFYHAGISVGAFYRISEKHSAGVSIESNMLLTADNRIETGSASSFEVGPSSEIATRGYVQGFRKIQYGVSLSYEYALGRNKSLGATYCQGLTDVTIDSYFGNEANRNSMLSIYFKLKLKS
jgi:hypothetical protein